MFLFDLSQKRLNIKFQTKNKKPVEELFSPALNFNSAFFI